MKINLKCLIVSIAIPLLTGFISYLITKDNINIYDTIVTPPLAPPAFLFRIVWPVLYTLMGISSYIIFQSESPYKKTALNVYLLSLVFNFIWSPIFFNNKEFDKALLILFILILLVLATIYVYRLISKPAAYLQIPYLIWLLFAFYLNYNILVMNK